MISTVALARSRTAPTHGHPGRLFERNLVVYRRGWIMFLSGFAEPVFYLFSIGIGLGALVGTVDVGGRAVPYAVFVAPAMLATSAMNGALAETTFNMFFRLKYQKLYDAVLATPMRPVDVALGEIAWALARGACYSGAFLGLMALLGYVQSWWGLLALPAAVLIGYAFGAVGMAFATFIRSWQDFDYVGLVMMLLFLLSATFYPLSVYPEAVRPFVEWTPLTQAVELVRDVTTGAPTLLTGVHALYLVVLAVLGSLASARRLDRLLRK